MTKLSKSEAVQGLWFRGDLRWKCHAVQQEMYDTFYNSAPHSTMVWLVSRQTGKSFLLALLAVETALRKPNSIIKLVTDTKVHVHSIFEPLFRELCDDAPGSLKPEFHKKDYIYTFQNGSQIQLAGTDGGHYERLRGQKSTLVLVDEAGFCTDLHDVVKSVLLPTTTHTGGKIVLATTPPQDPDHDFYMFQEEAEMNNTLTTKTIYDNPLLDEAARNRIIKEMGGVNSPKFKREYLCVDENTSIKTKTGYKPIKEIKRDEEVWTHKGRWKKVKELFKNPYDGRKMFQVKCSNNEGFYVTEGHKLYIATTNYKRDLNIITEGFKAVEEIKERPGDRTYFKIPLEPKKENLISEDLAYLYGWFTAEGHLGKQQQVWLSLAKSDPIQEINEASIREFGKPFKIYAEWTNHLQMALNSKIAKESFKICGVGAKNKKVPDVIKTAQLSAKIKYLKAYFEGDGYFDYSKNRAAAGSISKNLLAEISDLLLDLGITSTFAHVADSGVGNILGRVVNLNDAYALSVCGKNFQKLVKLFYNDTVIVGKNQTHLIHDDFLFSRITSIKEVPYEKNYVYDMEVEDDHSYTALHGLFHNCKRIRDEDNVAIPEFTPELEKVIVKEHVRPPFFDCYVSMDLGGKDFTALLFGYYDFHNDKVVIEDELVYDFKTFSFPNLIADLEKKEKALWFDPITAEQKTPYMRISDIDYIALQEIHRASGGRYNFTITQKDEKMTSVNNLRSLIAAGKIIISPKCVNLIRHLRNVRWDKRESVTKFARSADDGHYDLVDALIYMTRNMVYRKNPYPPGYNMNLDGLFIHNKSSFNNKYYDASKQAQVLKKLFNKR